MHKTAVLIATAALAAAAVPAGAEELGRVISSIPVIQQVAVPRQVCTAQPVAVQTAPSGAGAAIGGVVGGALGNQFGHGSGRAAATILGVVGGALLGNQVETNNYGGTQVQNQTTCTTQTFYENRTVAYNVTYEYAGKQYQVQMPQDPGPTLRLQVTPVGAVQSTDPAPAAALPAPVPAPMPVGQTTIIREVVAVPQPVAPVVYPGYYVRPYPPPVGLSLNFGYVRGGHGHWRY